MIPTLSRQATRWSDRQFSKQRATEARDAKRKAAKRALLERQTRREKAGFYGKPVADAISPSRSRVTSRKVKKGKAFGRILWTKTTDHEEIQFHATKGRRSFARTA